MVRLVDYEENMIELIAGEDHYMVEDTPKTIPAILIRKGDAVLCHHRRSLQTMDWEIELWRRMEKMRRGSDYWFEDNDLDSTIVYMKQEEAMCPLCRKIWKIGDTHGRN